jgi:uncharacterized membrane protein YeaQ/YmgE (transglycosylase-associated protein family)
MLGSVIAIMVLGFITGGLARLAVPGPDPMPIWLTVAIGLAGSWGGGAVAAAIWGWNSTTAVSFGGFFAAILLVVAYRRFIQKRPITGPEAHTFPERGFGMDRFRERKQQFDDLTRRYQQSHQFGQSQQSPQEDDSLADQLRKLSDLHDAGILTDEEYETKKAEVLARQ